MKGQAGAARSDFPCKGRLFQIRMAGHATGLWK
jgi:hypothetical protein